jgi:hypothetical protein
MTEPTTPDAQQTAPEATAAQPEQQIDSLPQWARDAISKANREAASYRTQVAELKPKAEQFTRLEEASKSDAQRLTEAAENARRDAEQARAEAVRYRVAATHGSQKGHPMAEYLPLHAPGKAITRSASATITAGQLVSVSGSGTVAPVGCGRRRLARRRRLRRRPAPPSPSTAVASSASSPARAA